MGLCLSFLHPPKRAAPMKIGINDGLLAATYYS